MKKTYLIATSVLALGLLSSLGSVYSLKSRNTKLQKRLQKHETAKPVPELSDHAVTAGKVQPKTEPRLVVTNVVSMPSEELNTLRIQLEEKERLVGELSEQLRQAREDHRLALQRATELERRQNTSRRDRFRERIEKLKQENPEEYAEYQERQERTRDRIKDTLARQSTFTLDLDTSNMTKEQMRNHEELLTVLQENWEYMETVEASTNAQETREVRRAIMRNAWRMPDLLETEREAALTELGRSLGYHETEAKEFSSAVEHIYDMTSLRRYWQSWRRPREPRNQGQ